MRAVDSIHKKVYQCFISISHGHYVFRHSYDHILGWSLSREHVTRGTIAPPDRYLAWSGLLKPEAER